MGDAEALRIAAVDGRRRAAKAEAVAAALQQRDLADAQNEVRALRSRPSIYTQPRGRPAGKDAVAPA